VESLAAQPDAFLKATHRMWRKQKMTFIPVGVDIAKNVMQVHFINTDTGEIFNKAIRRDKFLEFFTNRSPCLIGMEACGGAHHWARALTSLGHKVKLMPGEFVKAFNIRNKNDTADAQAIWRAVQQPGKAVAIKTEQQQAMLALHRIRPADEVSADADERPARVTR
jgi:transposase